MWVVRKDDHILFYPLKSIASDVGVWMKKQVIYTTPSWSLNDYELKHSSWERFGLRTKRQRKGWDYEKRASDMMNIQEVEKSSKCSWLGRDWRKEAVEKRVRWRRRRAVERADRPLWLAGCWSEQSREITGSRSLPSMTSCLVEPQPRAKKDSNTLTHKNEQWNPIKHIIIYEAETLGGEAMWGV